MKSTYLSILLSVCTLMIYQNCSPSHKGENGSSAVFSAEAVYPYYEEKPTFFDSVQLTKVFKEGSLWKYQFVASVVFIDEPEKNIDVEIKIFDQDGKILCPRKVITVNFNNNYISIDNCQSNKQAILAKIELYAKLSTESGAPILLNSYPFAIND
jgi:hypothetical protein